MIIKLKDLIGSIITEENVNCVWVDDGHQILKYNTAWEQFLEWEVETIVPSEWENKLDIQVKK